MEQSPVKLSTEGSLETAKTSTVRILHVDDDAIFLKTAKPILEMRGAFQVDTASSAEEAAGKMKTDNYDVVVCDYQMSGKDGLQFLEELRKSGNGVPFILFTGRGREEVVIRALNLGADGYINKQGSPETVYSELAHSVKSIVTRRKAEEALGISEEKYRAYVENSPVAFFVSNSERKYEQANDAACKLLGYTKEELLQMTTVDVVFEEDTPIALKHFYKLKETGKSRIELKLKRKDGNPVHVILNTVKLPDGKRIGFCEDITERKKAEEALGESEAKYRDLFESAMDAIITLDLKGKISAVNSSVLRFGFKKEDMVGKSMFDFVSKEYCPTVMRDFSKLAQGEPVKNEVELTTPSGKIIVEYHGGAITRENNVTGVQISLRDMTERKKAEKERQIQREELTMILDSLPLQIWYKDKDNRLVKVNKRFAEYMGLSKRDLEGKSLSDLFPPDIVQKCWEEDKEVIETGQSKIDILDHHESAQGLRWFLTSKVPCEDTDGKTIGTINFSFDITERKKAEENLKESEERYRQLIEFAPDPIFTCDLNGRLLDCNRQAEKLSGFKKEELLGKNILTSTRGRSLTKIVPERRTEPAEYELVSRDGSKFDVEISAFPVNRKGKVEIIAIGRDITERKKAEDTIRATRSLLELLVESSDDAIIGKTLDGTIVSWNSGAQKTYGYSPEEMIGKSISILVPPEIQEDVPTILDKIKHGEHINRYNTKRAKKDHTIIDVSITVSPIRDAKGNIIGASTIARDITERKKAETELYSERKRLLEVLETLPEMVCLLTPDYHVAFANRSFRNKFGESKGRHCYHYCFGKSEPCDFCETYEVLKTGKPHRWEVTTPDGSIIDACDFPFTDADGTHMILELDLDITESKKTEESLNRTMKQLAMTNEKLGVVGKLTRHDVRNKLFSAINNVYLAKQSLPENSKALAYLGDIELACRQTTRILDFAAAYECLGVEELVLMDVEKAVEEAVSLVSELKDVKVVNNCQGLTVMADSVLRQLFFNLIENSLKHGKNVSQIKIHYKQGKDRLRLFYEDNGVGIFKANKPKLFDWGFTTGNGSGYGLPLIKAMMKRYGWTIEEEGEPGRGAKFVITIPMKADSNQKQRYGDKKAFS